MFSLNRISGNAASSKNIHGTVSEQLKKNFAKSRWKVSDVDTLWRYVGTFLHAEISFLASISCGDGYKTNATNGFK